MKATALFLIILAPAALFAQAGTYVMTEVAAGSAEAPDQFGVPNHWTQLSVSSSSRVVVEMELFPDGTGRERIGMRESEIRYEEWSEEFRWDLLPGGFLQIDQIRENISGERYDITVLISEIPSSVGDEVYAVQTAANPRRIEDRVTFWGDHGVTVLSETGLANFMVYRIERVE